MEFCVAHTIEVVKNSNGKTATTTTKNDQSNPFSGTVRVYCVFNMNVINLCICLLYEQTQSKTRISFAEKEKKPNTITSKI